MVLDVPDQCVDIQRGAVGEVDALAQLQREHLIVFSGDALGQAGNQLASGEVLVEQRTVDGDHLRAAQRGPALDQGGVPSDDLTEHADSEVAAGRPPV